MRARYPDSEGFVERDGVKIAYEVFGSGGPPRCVFALTDPLIHSRAWKAQVPYLAREVAGHHHSRGAGQSAAVVRQRGDTGRGHTIVRGQGHAGIDRGYSASLQARTVNGAGPTVAARLAQATCAPFLRRAQRRRHASTTLLLRPEDADDLAEVFGEFWLATCGHRAA